MKKYIKKLEKLNKELGDLIGNLKKKMEGIERKALKEGRELTEYEKEKYKIIEYKYAHAESSRICIADAIFYLI